MPKTMKVEDKYRCDHAQICIRCNKVRIEERGGLRWQVCEKCAVEIRELITNWEENGLYMCEEEVKKPSQTV